MRILFFTLYILLALPVSADWVDVLSVSPQKTWQIQRRQPGNLTGGDPEYIDFVDLKTGRIVFSLSSIRRSANVAWNSTGSLVCINDRIATSGDFLYIFRITNGQITLVRAPCGDALTGQLKEAYAELKSTGRFTVTGQRWLGDSTLLVRLSGGGYGDDATLEAPVRINDLGRLFLDMKFAKKIDKN